VSAGDFQFERVDPRFFIPDIAVAHPGTTSNAEFQENIALVVEVTSPKSPETVENDYGIKAEQYAEAGVPVGRVANDVWRAGGAPDVSPVGRSPRLRPR
jgi:Uma2 family endonuclease